ncbi:hypothetical protein L3Q72_15120 [Vibrio sp. JC009]|uniref:hypothetical protein n=1 Tax=Vibrio sp. JC009 TaxID=2912314 RepID=UPI0023B1FF4B|nr:hypothetical protein [Vibrio sp. JC009]WED24212.1 hypothetical protein L3Q72_15120 [Vibrio sp. JC009]
MEAILSQLKKDFHAKLNDVQSEKSNKSTIALLTEEELSELETVWIQHAIWKQNNLSA